MKIKDFGVETWINNYEKDCKYNLSGTCVGILAVDDLIKMTSNPQKTLSEMLNIELGYGEVFGSLRLRNNIASLYDKASYENISIAHGAIGANSLAYLTLIEPDDEIVSILPVYEQHYSIPQSINAKVKKIFDIKLSAKLSSKTQPASPSGSLVTTKYGVKASIVYDAFTEACIPTPTLSPFL